MILGDCPYDGCRGVLCMSVPENTPAYILTECPECKQKIWYRLSRVDPKAWTQKEFESAHTIDPLTHIISGFEPEERQ